MRRISLIAALLALVLPTAAGAVGVLVVGDPSVGPLGIKYHRVTARVTDRAAVTRVEQVFVNPTDRVLEGEYVFPLPKGASVSDFALWINGKKQQGELLERDRARQIYETIVRRMKDPGLLEYIGNDLFRCKVYPIPARGEQRLEVEFQQLLPFTAGVLSYVYPMRTDARSARTLEDFTVSVEINSKTPIKSVYSPTHRVGVNRKGDHAAVAGFERDDAALDRDFELYYSISEKDVGVNLLAHNVPGEPGYFMLMISPKSSFAEQEIAAKHISFVLDTSGSMAGEKMERARAALTYALNRLREDDLFDVIRFSSDVEALEAVPMRASKDNVQKALAFVQQMEAAGGTAIHDALLTALAQRGEGTRIIVFITDGRPTIGETEPEPIARAVSGKNQGQARLFVFGVGDSINTRLLDRLAADNRGTPMYVKPNEEIEEKISQFYDRVRFPVLTDVELELGKVRAFDVFPRRLPDLFKGDQLLVLGRYRSPGEYAIRLSGKLKDRDVRYDYEAEYPQTQLEYDFLPRLWALRKVGYLLEEIRARGEQGELRDEVIRLAKRYGIVTPYTAYLVTEDEPATETRRPTPDRRPRPLEHRATTPRDGGGGGRSGGSATATPAPDASAAAADDRDGFAPMGGLGVAPTERKAEARRRDAMKAKAMEEEAGADAVALSAEIQRLKQSRTAGAGEGGVRHLAGRTFEWRDGAWVEQGATGGTVRRLQVQYLSEAYFTLLALRPELKRVLSSLGGRAVVLLGPGKAVEIGEAGKAKPDAELERFVK